MSRRYSWLLSTSMLALTLAPGSSLAQESTLEQRACEALRDIRGLTITSAGLREGGDGEFEYCYVKGIISPAIQFHAQLPLPEHWNGRFLKWGDGGKDGDLDFADGAVAQGYAVANSNTGHDRGAEPGASFGFNNRQAEIDFGYRAVHLTANAAKTIIGVYYGEAPAYSYFLGCSTGGRQGLMEAQRYPDDFDGILAGAPVNFYQAMHASGVWTRQRLFRNDFAGNLAFDSNGDGSFDSLTKLSMLHQAVLAKCDANDGITDGVIDDPLACDFDPAVDLADMMCPGDVNADDCFTRAQVQMIQDLYAGAYDNEGTFIYKGLSLGSEFSWAGSVVPHAGNSMSISGNNRSHMNYLFYETDPGVPVPDPTDLSYTPDKMRTPPEWAWWEFDIDDFTAGRADLMMSITDATDPDLRRFLVDNDGKLILYPGWGDQGPRPEATLDHYEDIVATTFSGDLQAARDRARLFMFPGMGHCGGGPGPNQWDRLPALVDWVENGHAPDFVVATHRTDGIVDNERRVCAYPERAFYTGPARRENDPTNWVESNFACR